MDLLESYTEPLAAAGAVFVAFYSIRLFLYLFRGIRSYFIAPYLNLGVDVQKLGSWAVVTGATDGIGKSYAKALARRGMNIVLISRTPSKLDHVAAELREQTGVQTKCIAVDFTGGMEIYAQVDRQLEGLEIGVLINNVGMSYTYPDYLLNVEDRDNLFKKLIHINIYSVTFMTTTVLSRMVDKGKGAIVNVGSASHFGFPLLTVYVATKSYVDSFTKNLACEYKNKGIIFQSVIPWFVLTNMTTKPPPLAVITTPDTVAESSINTIGLDDCTPASFSHWIQVTIAEAAPIWGKWFFLWCLGLILKKYVKSKQAKKNH